MLGYFERISMGFDVLISLWRHLAANDFVHAMGDNAGNWVNLCRIAMSIDVV
jgi:hypothetical protein